MPTCPTCGSEDYELFDGHYFCNECSTQSQEIREQREDEDSMYQTQGKRRRITKHSQGQGSNRTEDDTPVWFTCEAVNLVIYHQVEALIRLGASPQLKEIVMELWFAYLKKCEMAFVSNQEDWVPRLPLFPTLRDLHAFNGLNRSNSAKLSHPVRKRSDCQIIDGKLCYYKRTSKKRKKIMKAKKRLAKLMKDKASDTDCETTEKDSETETDSNKTPRFRLSDTKNYSKSACKEIKKHGLKKIYLKKGAVQNCIDRLTVTKAISFCYMGLLLLGEQIILSDIVRWIREGHIPYFNVYLLMPETMKLKDKDLTFLKSVQIPEVGYIAKQASRLLTFLDRTEIPGQPVCNLAARFIMDLNLPHQLSSAIRRLTRKTFPELATLLFGPCSIKSKKFIPRYDMQAASLIIVVLKTVFGLNGKTERELSEKGKEANSNMSAGRTIFVWDEWQMYISLNLNMLRCKNVSSVFYSTEDTLDVGNLHSFCKEMRIRVDTKNCTPSRDVLRRRAVHKSFSTLAEQQPFVRCWPNSFPIATSTFECASGVHEATFFSRDFSTHSLPGAAADFTETDVAGYWQVGPGEFNAKKAKRYLANLPRSMNVLVDSLLYVTSGRAHDLFNELRRTEKLLFKLLAKKQLIKGT